MQTRMIEIPAGCVPVLIQITPRANGAKKLDNAEIVGRCHVEILEPVETRDGQTRFCPVTAGSVTVFRNADGSYGLPLTPVGRNAKAIYVDSTSELGRSLVGAFNDATPATDDDGDA